MPWQLTDQLAVGSTGDCQIRLNPTDPTRFAVIEPQSHAAGQAWESFSVRPLPAHSLTPEEVYVRGNDLIARFAQAEADVYAFQLDWHLLPVAPPFMAGIELWLSIQTALLDTRPEMEVACHARQPLHWQAFTHTALTQETAAEPLAPRGPAAMVSQAQDVSGVWLIEPSDQRHAQLVSPAGEATVRARLFGHFMEKGVIRRARMRFLIAAGQIATSDISQAYHDFSNSPLPLTA